MQIINQTQVFLADSTKIDIVLDRCDGRHENPRTFAGSFADPDNIWQRRSQKKRVQCTRVVQVV
ncbi:hypothetical protein COCHEDRAFT_1021125, partial [Bipolaris maydis C5]